MGSVWKSVANYHRNEGNRFSTDLAAATGKGM